MAYYGYILYVVFMKFLAVPVFVLGLLLAPGYAEAQTPDPIVEAIEAVEAGTPHRAKITNSFTMKLFGETLKIGTKGSAYTDASGNAEGKITTSLSGGGEKFSVDVDYKYFADSGDFYFKLNKLPKDVPDSLAGVRAKTWYVSSVADSESLSQAIGQAQLTGEHFLQAQEVYPAIEFVEKGSTKKEYKYTYTINEGLLPAFLMEQARLAGGKRPTQSEAQFSASFLEGLSGTLTINKKTLLPAKQTQQLGSSKDAMSIKSSITYIFGGSSQVKRPSGAIKDIGGIAETLFPSL